MKIKLIWLFLLVPWFIYASDGKSPSQIYSEYNSRVIEGISFVEDKAYFSKRKQQEVENKMPQYMEQMNKTRDEVIEIYMEVSREVAKCKEIVLSKEVIEGETALLVYSQKDICGNESTSEEKQTIRMIQEDGWKIDDIEISL